MVSGDLGCVPSSLFKDSNYVYPRPAVGARRAVSLFPWPTQQTAGGSPTDPCIPGREPALRTHHTLPTKTAIFNELFSFRAHWDALDDGLANAKLCWL